MNRFEPVNLIIQKPICGVGRSGSLPPIKSRLNYKNSHHLVETSDHSHHQHHQSNYSYAQESKMAHYKELQQRHHHHNHHHHQPVVFKPVELVLDANNIETSGKRVRECSVPCSGFSSSSSNKRRVYPSLSYSCQHMNLLPTCVCAYSCYQSCCYDPVVVCTDNESITSDFISDRLVEPVCQYGRQHHQQHHQHQHHHQHQQHHQTVNHHRASVSSIDERFVNQNTNSYGSVEMNIDVKSPPCIDVPLRNVQTSEGETVKLECVVSGK